MSGLIAGVGNNKRDIESLCDRARSGCTESLGELLEGCRRYLLLVASKRLQSDLQMKAGPSDLVQETLLEAQRDFAQFHGTNERQLLAWLRQILLHNLTNFERHYLHTEQRQVRRETRLEVLGNENGDLQADGDSPSTQAVRSEEAEILDQALALLPDEYRQVIILRHREGHSFATIGESMNRSVDSARMLWWRAFERLAKEIKSQP